jgi:hypothetical protein
VNLGEHLVLKVSVFDTGNTGKHHTME